MEIWGLFDACCMFFASPTGRQVIYLWSGTELKHSSSPVGFTRIQPYRWKIRLVRTIGKVLSFQTKSSSFFIGLSFSFNASIKEVCRIKLYTWLGSLNSHLPSSSGIEEYRSSL